MRLFGLNITRDTASPVRKTFTPEQWLRGEDLDSGGSVLSNSYQQVVWVYRAINALAEQVANIPFLFSAGDRGRETLITTGPLLDFYNHPHPQVNRFQYWELRVIWLMLRGECFRVPIYSDDRNLNHNLDLNRPASSPRTTEHGTRNTRHSNHRFSFLKKSGSKNSPTPLIPGAACLRFMLQKQQPGQISPPASS